MSDYSEDTDEFIEHIRNELEGHDVMAEPSFGDIPIQQERFPRFSTTPQYMEYPKFDDVGDVNKLLYDNVPLDGYLTDDEYELERRDSYQELDLDQTPVNTIEQHRVLGGERLGLYQQMGIVSSSPDIFQTPMHFPKTAATNWDENEIETLKNKINRQSLSHKSQLEEHRTRQKAAELKFAKSYQENQLIMKGMKIQLSKLQQKIRDMQSEKVRLVSDCNQQSAPKEEVIKFKEIAEHYKCIVNEQDSKVANLEQLIHGLNTDVTMLNGRLSDKDREILELSEKLKEQAREFAISQTKKQTEAQDNLNKSQKLHHREKVLSVAKLQEDLSQSYNEEVYSLKNTLLEEKNRALSRLEDSFTQRLSKVEENSKKLEKELKSSTKKIEEKDDVIKKMEILHKKEVQDLNSEIHKLQSTLQKASKDVSQNKTQAAAKLRQDSEQHILYRIKLAVESNQKAHQAEIHRLKTNLKRATDKLNSMREQTPQLVRKDKGRKLSPTNSH